MQPEISVLMPVWNGCRNGNDSFLRKAIESILQQTFENWEMIVVDDGSADDTPRVLSSYADSDPRIRPFRLHRNSGIVAALNFGLERCCSNLVARQDADDLSTVTRLEIQKKFLDDRPGTAMCGSWMYVIDEQGKLVMECNDRPCAYAVVREELKNRCVFVHGSVMFRKDAVMKVGGYSTDLRFRHAEDYELWVRLAKDNVIENMPGRTLYFHRNHSSKISTVYQKQQETASSLIAEIAEKTLSSPPVREPAIEEGELLHRGEHCSVHRRGEKVVKKFDEQHLATRDRESLFYRESKGIRGIPEVLEEGKDYISIPFFKRSLLDLNASSDIPERKKLELMNSVAEIAYDLFMAGICHGDLYEENIMFDEIWNPYLIDPMTVRYPPDVPFAEAFDLSGGRPVPPEHSNKQVRPCLELLAKQTHYGFKPFNYLCNRLAKKIIACSGSETYNESSPRQPYSSYDFPGIFELDGWRNTRARFDCFVPSERQAEEFGGKSILDVGCNAGAVSLRAGFLGAKRVLGIDINSERVNVGNEVSKFMGLSGVVNLVHGNVADDAFLTSQGAFDAAFCLAVSGRMGNEMLFLTNLCKSIKETIYFESNHSPEGFQKYIDLFRQIGFRNVEYKGSTERFPTRHSLTAKR